MRRRREAEVPAMFRPHSLQQRFTWFMIIPVTLLLIGMGIAGFFYARDMLLDQWREAAILKLQRAAHEVDMRLGRIKEWIQLFHEGSGSVHSDAFHAWVLEQLAKQEGVSDITITWNTPEDRIGAGIETPSMTGRQRGRPGMGQQLQKRQLHSARIREITPPRFDASGEHGTVSLVSDLNDINGQTLGHLATLVDFNFIFRHVQESGWWQSSKAFLVDDRGDVLVCTIPGRHGNLADAQDWLERETFNAMAALPFGTLSGPGHPPSEVSGFYHLQEAPWVLVMIAPGREILAPIIELRTLYAIFGIAFVVVIVALIWGVLARTTSNIRQVSGAALRLSGGEFGAPLPVKSRDEVGELTRSFNLMTSQLQERLNLKEAMNLAMEVQQNLLPTAPPSVAGLDLAGRSLYCQETGGDYFDYILRPSPAGSPRLCVAVGDVVGHGISAALLMTTVRALLRCRLDQPVSIAEAVYDVNRLLYQDTAPSGSFVTLFLLEVDSAAGRLEWVRAGHDPAWLYCAATDEVQELGGPGMALGVDDACSYRSGSRPGLGADDVLLIGTDGIWETQNATSEKFGKERIGKILMRHHHLSAEGILQVVLDALEDFRGKAQQEDDITLLVLKSRGTSQS
jgi:sigma-B regulation protein RsbU (phosphoserine phosphatase)